MKFISKQMKLEKNYTEQGSPDSKRQVPHVLSDVDPSFKSLGFSV